MCKNPQATVYPTLPRRPPLHDALRWAAVASAYVLGTILFLWPMPAHLGTRVWGDRFDAWTTLWLIDHLHRHIADGSLTAETTEILFPIGYNMWSFGHAALQLLGAGLMFLGFPLVTAYNLLLIGGFASSGFAAHALGKALSRDHLGGFVAGTVFASSPYLYGEGAAGCIELVAAGFLPMFALTLVMLVRAPDWKRAAACAAVLAIIGPFNWYYTLFAGILGAGVLGWQVAAGRWRAAAWMAAAITLAAALDSPLIPLVRRETPTRPPVSAELFSDSDAWTRVEAISDGTTPLASITAAAMEEHDALQVMQNSTTVRAFAQARFTVNPLQSTPGMVAFLIGICGAATAGRRGAMWAWLAVGASVLTLGPFLRIDETPPLPVWAGKLPLPYYFFYQYVPFFSKAYRPYRIGVVTLTCCAALGAAGFGVLALEVRRRWLRMGVLCLGIIAATQPFWSGDRPALRPIADPTIPEIYTRLADLPPGGVVEVPLQYQPLTTANARFQFNQIAHHHPTLNCNQLIRRTELLAFQRYVTRNAFLATLLDLARQRPPFAFSAADLAGVFADGFRYVVVHTSAEADDVQLSGAMTAADLLTEPAFEMLDKALGEPVLQDGDSRVYAVPNATHAASWVWTGEDVVPLELPLDAKRFGLPTVLPTGGTMQIWEGEARQLSFWARGAGSAPVVVRITGADGQKDVPIVLDVERWRWIRIPLSQPGRLTLSLAAPQQGASLWITRAQVLR